VTIDGVTRPLPEPFLVLATENPIEQEGTFPLPEAQLDRFFLRTALGYPSEDDEVAIVEQQLSVHPLRLLKPVLSLTEVHSLRTAVESVYIDPVIRRWVIQLVRATREADGVAIGASVRGSLALERASRAWALLRGREYVTPVDVEDLFLSVVMHRIVFTPSFVAAAREIGWTAASDRFREQCVEMAPRPGAELEPEDDEALAVAQ
jgi:MoxR-like ATPase